MKFSKILFPVDFSIRSHAAVPHVRTMAEQFNASVTLLHVMERPPAWPDATNGGDYPPLDVPRMMEYANEHLSVFAAAELPSADVARLVEEGDPGSMIAEVATARSVDLIMMPTAGHGLFRSALLGSTAAKVLHDAHCAVWTGAHLEDAEIPKHTAVRTILCALDLEEGSLDLLKKTKHLAEAFDATALIAHSVPIVEATPEMYLDKPLDMYLRDNAILHAATLQEKAGTAFESVVEFGAVSDVVRTVSQRFNVDLVVIGRGALAHFTGRLRTNVYGVIREAGCPVLSFPPREIIL